MFKWLFHEFRGSTTSSITVKFQHKNNERLITNRSAVWQCMLTAATYITNQNKSQKRKIII